MPVVIGKHLLNRQITVNKMEFRKQIVMINSQLIQYSPSSVAIYCLSIIGLFYVCFYTTFIITVVTECLPVVHVATWLASVTRCLFPHLLPRENSRSWGAFCFGKAWFFNQALLVTAGRMWNRNWKVIQKRSFYLNTPQYEKIRSNQNSRTKSIWGPFQFQHKQWLSKDMQGLKLKPNLASCFLFLNTVWEAKQIKIYIPFHGLHFFLKAVGSLLP